MWPYVTLPHHCFSYQYFWILLISLSLFFSIFLNLTKEHCITQPMQVPFWYFCACTGLIRLTRLNYFLLGKLQTNNFKTKTKQIICNLIWKSPLDVPQRGSTKVSSQKPGWKPIGPTYFGQNENLWGLHVTSWWCLPFAQHKNHAKINNLWPDMG